MNNRVPLLVVLCLSVWNLAACSSPPTNSDALPLLEELPALISNNPEKLGTSIADSDIAPHLSAKWRELTILPHKRKTSYKIAKLDGSFVLQATADRSASGIQALVDIDSAKKPILSFAWRADAFAQDGDVADRSLDDSPVRIMIAFDGDHETLSARDRLTSDQVKMLTGRPLPYATLMYVWSNAQELEAVVINPHSQRVRKIVLSNKNTVQGKWHSFRRNIVADYERAYGKKPKGRIKAIAIMTDSDNTADKAVAYYRDIELLSR
jgi:Protein of unknown function (DUF3047)